MTRPLLKRRWTWEVELSHMIAVPQTITASDPLELRRRVQEIADSKIHSPVGQIEFSEEGDIIRCYFRDKHGEKRRFMRLRRL